MHFMNLRNWLFCRLDISEPEMALNGLISVQSENSDKLPTEVSDELASIQDAGRVYVCTVCSSLAFLLAIQLL